MAVTDRARARAIVVGAAGARSAVIGFTGVALGLYLGELRVPATKAGAIIGLGLAGTALATALVTVAGDRLGRVRLLVATSALGAAGLGALALTQAFPLLALAAFAGMLNGMGRDRGGQQVLDQAVLADQSATEPERTAVFARYTLIQDVLGSVGSLAAGVPALLARMHLATGAGGYRATFAATAALALASCFLYAQLPPGVEAESHAAGTPAPLALSARSRRRIAGLSGLFAVDSIGGGLLAGSIISYWFFRRFGVGGEVLGPVFFAAKILNALSYVGAAWLARKIGLLRTMVFTHLPSSAVLLALPWVPSAGLAVTVFLVRESLVQMDVPARQSFVAALTEPGERTFALGVTGLTRNVGWAVGPALAGVVSQAFGIGAPLVCGAVTKAIYDVALYAGYRRVQA